MSVRSESTKSGVLGRLTSFLRDDLEKVDHLIRDALRSRINLTNEVGQYLQATPGKRLRPMLALLAARIERERHENAVLVAAVAELLHVASLLHDDVIDFAALRRGNPTVNARWGNDVAILTADYLYSHAFRKALEGLPSEMSVVFCRATASMAEGEIFQIEKRGALLTEKDYLFIIRCKTAVLFSACMEVGSAVTNGDGKITEALKQYGLDFGYAFQITDDVLDLTADPRDLGKEIGTDIATGKQTLPLIRAIEKADPDDHALLVEALNNGQPPPSVVVECVRKYGGIEYALDVARRYARRARATLKELPPSPVLDYLRELTELVVDRSY